MFKKTGQIAPTGYLYIKYILLAVNLSNGLSAFFRGIHINQRHQHDPAVRLHTAKEMHKSLIIYPV